MSEGVSIQDVVGQSVQLRVGDKLYTLSSIRMLDLAELEKWVQAQPLREVNALLRELGESLTPTERRQYLVAAVDRSRSLRLWGPDDEMAPELKTVGGIAELLYLALRKNHPTITREEVLSFPPDNLEAVKGTLARLGGFVGDLGKDEGPGQTTPA